jgi:drug/metabolite transporter (DMT)-like permease
MNAGLLGSLAALAWGTHDFLARFPSRSIGPASTVLAVTAAGFLLLSAWLAVGGAAPRIVWPSLWLAGVTGLFYALGTLSLFAALALGPISVVAPVAGSYPALAVAFAVAAGARPTWIQWAGTAAVLLGVTIVSRSGGQQASGEGVAEKRGQSLALAFGASFGFAVSFTSGQAAVPIFGVAETAWLARIFGLALIGLIWLLPSTKRQVPARWLPVLGLMGGLDVTAQLLVVAAGHLPDAALATVTSSAFGAVTVLLARLFLKDKVTPTHLLGIAMIFAGVAVLAGQPA